MTARSGSDRAGVCARRPAVRRRRRRPRTVGSGGGGPVLPAAGLELHAVDRASAPSTTPTSRWRRRAPISASTQGDTLFIIVPGGQLEFIGQAHGVLGQLPRLHPPLPRRRGPRQLRPARLAALRRLVTRRLTLFAARQLRRLPTTDEVELNGVPFRRTGSRTNTLRRRSRTTASRKFTTLVDPLRQHLGRVRSPRHLPDRRLDSRAPQRAHHTGSRSGVSARRRVQLPHAPRSTSGGREFDFQDAGGVVHFALGPHTSANGRRRVRDAARPQSRRDAHAAPTSRLGVDARRSSGPRSARRSSGSTCRRSASAAQQQPGAARLRADAAASSRLLHPGLGGLAPRSTPFEVDALELDTIWLRSTLGYAAARWLRVEALYTFTRQDSIVDRRRSRSPPRRRAVRHLTTHEDPVMEERRFHPLDYLSVLRRRKWWFIVPLVLCDRRRRGARDVPAARVQVRGGDRHRRSDAVARAAARRAVARRRGTAARGLAAAAEPHRARAGRPRREPVGPAGRSRRPRPRCGRRSRTTSSCRSRSAACGDGRDGIESFRLGYVDASPERAQRIANRLATVFVEENSKTQDAAGARTPRKCSRSSSRQPGAAGAAAGAAAREEAGEHGPAARPDERQHLRWSTACASSTSRCRCSCAPSRTGCRCSRGSSSR